MRISVCLATYNGAKYLHEQLDSILCQLSESDEVVISDDGSSDATIDIIRSYNDNRIHLYFNKGRHGYIYNFDNAFVHAHGDLIFLSDQDDVWLPNKVQTITPLLDKYDLVLHDANLIDGKGETMGKTYYSTIHKRPGFFANLCKGRFLGCCMAFKRCVLDYSMPMVPVIGHDYWIGMLALAKFNVLFANDVLINYRRHGNNASFALEKGKESLIIRIKKKLYTVKMLLIKIL